MNQHLRVGNPHLAQYLRFTGTWSGLTAILAASVFLFLTPFACAQSGPVVWVAPSLQRVGQTDAPGNSTLAQIYAAKRQSVSFQIVVSAAGAGLTNVNVSVSDLTGPGGQTIPHTDLALFREQYMDVATSSPNWGGSNQPLPPGWYADGLIPFADPGTGLPITGASLEAVPFSVSVSQNQPIWVDVNVPSTAAAGYYTGTFTVSSTQGSATGTIGLTVWNFTLPLKPTMKSSFLYWTASSDAAIEELLRNRLNPERTPAASQLSMMNNYGLTTQETGFWSGADIGNCTMSAAPTVSQFQAAAAAQQPGLFLYNYTADEINACTNLYTTMQQWAYNMHQAGIDNLVTMAPVPALYSDGSSSGRSAVDIWVMLPVTYNGAVSNVNYVLAKGDQAWSYNCLVQDAYSPKWMIDFAPINFRIQPGFINQSLGLSGLLYWRVDDWSSSPWTNPYAPGFSNYPGEAILVYPGSTVGIAGVAPSMRLKWLRDGVNDYEYIDLLKKAGQGAWALSVANSVGANWSSWTRDINALENARLQLGEKLDQLGGGGSAPVAPSNPAPATGATGVTLSPTLSWTAASGATSYNVYFGTTASPGLAGNTTGTSYSPGTLSANTTYYWSVVAVNSSGSTSSATWSFTTQVAVPGTPANPSPTNGATGVSLTPALTWSAASGAASYNVYFGTTSSCAQVGSTTGTSYSPGTLSANTTYYWRVVAVNAAGSTSSATWSFTTQVAVPGTPANPAPANGATGVSPTPALTWSAASGAASYNVYFGTTSSCAQVGSTTGTSYSPGTLSANTIYYWRVVAVNAAGSTSSATWSFTTQVAVPGTPANTSPASGATGVSPTPALTWSAASGATSYNVYFGTTSSCAQVGSTTGTSYSPGTLSANTIYYWRVVAVNAAGSTSSATWSFTTQVAVPGTPASPSPASAATGVSLTPALTWSAASGATSYNVYFGTTSSCAQVGSTTGTSYSPGTLSASTVYYWRVVAVNAAGSTSSATWSFTTAAPVPVNPAPIPVSVTPSSGSGLVQVFTFTYSVPKGLENANVLINTAASGQSACWFNYSPSGNSLSLAADNAGSWSYATLGSTVTLQNSQCSIQASTATYATSASNGTSGANVTLKLTVIFKTAFAGLKNIYLRAQDLTGAIGGFVQMGSWTIPN
ncbi:MAG: glycoside hydrolase domain-containing protein [Bryobacteraceae bacterium]